MLLFTLVLVVPVAYATDGAFIRLNPKVPFTGNETIHVWKVEDTPTAGLPALVDSLEDVTDAALTARYGAAISERPEAGATKHAVTVPGEGTYYVRVEGQDSEMPLFYPFAVTLPYEGSLQLDVHPKRDVPDTEPPDTEETEPPDTEITEPPGTEETEPPDTEET